MILCWHYKAWDEYLYWQKTDKKTLNSINKLIKEIIREPYQGIGKPEPLKHQWQGFWSRRIDSVNRLVYKVEDNKILIAQCRFHY